MKGRLILAAITTFGLIAATAETIATEKLSLRVTPNVSSAPSTVIARAVVARHADNRWLFIEADSETFYRSSAIQLDGARAPVVTEIRLNGLPGGTYTVAAILRNSTGEQTSVRRTVVVLPGLGEERFPETAAARSRTS